MINVNAIASHLPTRGVASELAPLLQQLAKKADTNRDGQVSSTEFTDFLGKLMQSLDESQRVASGSPTSSEPSAAAPIPVSTSSAVPLPIPTQTAGAAAIRAIVASLSKER